MGEQVTVMLLVVDVPAQPAGRLQANPYGVEPPETVAEQVKGLVAVTPEVGHVTVTVSGWAVTVTGAEAVALLAAESLSTTVTVRLPPFELQVMLMLDVVEAPVHPVGRVQVKVFPPAPPLAVALQVKGFPTVIPVVGHERVTVRGAEVTTLQVLVAPLVVSSCTHKWLG